jgi:hypothetical protein
MKHKLISTLVIVSLLSVPNNSAIAAIDLQADLNRIIAGINKFDSNSATSSSVSNMSDVKRIFSNNSSILREISAANAVFKRDLNSARNQIPSRDTKESPAFATLMGLVYGYEDRLKYQFVNQTGAQKCISGAGGSFTRFSNCSIAMLPKTMENERIGRQKLQAAWNAWKLWQVKYGYA